MGDAVVTLVVAAISVASGYVIWSWQHRIRPWLAPLAFDETVKARQRVPISPELVSATKTSILVPSLAAGSDELEDVRQSFAHAKQHLINCKGSPEILGDGIKQLSASTDLQAMIEAIQTLLMDSGISNTLEMAIVSGKIALPKHDPALEVAIPYSEDKQEDGGCFVFELPTSGIRFGRVFVERPVRRRRLEPFAELVSRAEQAKLVTVFTQLVPILHQQISVSEDIAKDTEAILQSYARWQCQLSVTNFGSTAFVLFQDRAWLLLQDKGTKPIRLPCDLIRLDKDGDWVLAPVVQVVEPGTTQDLGVVTRDIQKDMDSGHLVRAIFREHTGSARVEVEALGLASIGRRRLQTQFVPFKES